MIPILVLLIFTLMAYRFNVDGIGKRLLLFSWFVKAGFGLVFLLVHTKIYGITGTDLDWIEYMADSVTLNNVAYQDFSVYLKFLFGTNTFQESVQYLSHTNHWDMGDLSVINDSRNLLKINSLVVFVSHGNIYVHILFYSFISFFGLIEFYRAIKSYSRLNTSWIWLLLLLMPSLGFWTSSVLKEPLMITGLAILIHTLMGDLSWKSRSWRILLGLLLMCTFKPYVLVCFAIAMLVYLLARYVFVRKRFWIPITLIAIAGVTLSLNQEFKKSSVHRLTRMQFDFMNIGRGGIHVYVDSFSYYFRVDQLNKVEILHDSLLLIQKPLTVKKLNTGMKYPFADVHLKPGDGPFKIIYIGTKATSFIELTPINSSLTQLVLNVPEAFFNAAFRPFPWDPGGNLKWLNFMEMLCLFSLLFYAIQKNWNSYSTSESSVIWFLLSFAFVLLVLIGWTTPVLGALVRYRLPAYVAILLVTFIGYSTKEIKNE